METTPAEIRLAQLRKLYQENKDRIEKEFFEFLRIPSISSESEYRPQVRACANWLVKYLEKMGFTVELWEVEGHHPTLFATHLKAGSDKPTVLLYNHYDVQPVDPLDKWHSPPFEPAVRNGEVYARGAQDNKGQCFYTLQAIESLLKEKGSLPVNLKLCIEGEEEMGSAALMRIVKDKSRELQADHLFIIDLGIPNLQTPAVTLGIRGLVTMTLEMTGSSTDLHSGEHGGLVYNPNRALVELLAKLHDADGKVTIPGFYNDVKLLSEHEKTIIDFGFDISHYESTFKTKAIGGEKAFSPLESSWVRPTCEINGISGGYAGTGFKTVIPAKAIAKISFRLVPNQDPEKILNLVEEFLKDQTPPGVELKIERHQGGGPAMRTDPQSIAVQAVKQAYEEVFKAPCKFILQGATISIVPALKESSGAETVMLGLGLADDQIHAPNEHFGLNRLELGHLIIARALEILGNE